MATKFRKIKTARSPLAKFMAEFASDLEELSGDAIDVKSIDIDWQERLGENCDGWTSYEANRCEKCDLPVVLNAGQGNEAHKDCGVRNPEECPECGGAWEEQSVGVLVEDEDLPVPGLKCSECGVKVVDVERCTGHVSQAEGPMMNYYYPIRLRHGMELREAAKKIAHLHLPLCLVEFEDGSTALALTGGGMDLTWEICEAFILLGFLPPVAFSRVPDMAGYELTPRRRLIIAACVKANEVMKRWSDSNVADIERTVAGMQRDEAERKAREKKEKSK